MNGHQPTFWQSYLLRVTDFWGRHVLLAIGSILIIITVFIDWSFRNLSYPQSFLVAGVLAISFASIASEIPGMLNVQLGRTTGGLAVSAAGALGVFVLTLLLYFHYAPSPCVPP